MHVWLNDRAASSLFGLGVVALIIGGIIYVANAGLEASGLKQSQADRDRIAKLQYTKACERAGGRVEGLEPYQEGYCYYGRTPTNSPNVESIPLIGYTPKYVEQDELRSVGKFDKKEYASNRERCQDAIQHWRETHYRRHFPAYHKPRPHFNKKAGLCMGDRY